MQWLQDIFPEVATAVLPPYRRLIAKAATPIRDAVLKRSDAVVTIGERMRQYVVSRGVPTDNVSFDRGTGLTIACFTRCLRPLTDACNTVSILRRVCLLATKATWAERTMRRPSSTQPFPSWEGANVRFVLTGGGVGFDLSSTTKLHRQPAYQTLSSVLTCQPRNSTATFAFPTFI